MKIRVGFGFDVHRQEEGRELWIGGIKLEYTKGLAGHSDADVLLHAICDALLGAANLRDIGFHFPDTAKEYKDVDSKLLLKKTLEVLTEKGYRVGNIDATIVAERPKINPHVPEMQKVIADILKVEVDDISIKASTSERIGYVGREEGMTAYAVALIEKI